MPEGTINAVGLIVAYLREAEDSFGARGERLLTPAEHEFVKFLAFVHADAYGRGPVSTRRARRLARSPAIPVLSV